MPTKGTTPTQIRIPDDVKSAVKARSAVTGETLSAMVVRLLRAEVMPTPPAAKR